MAPTRLLLVDDHRLFAESLETVLTSRCEDMAVAGVVGNGALAVAFVEANDVDVILMDVRMPEMDGVEATRRIVDRKPSIRIIMLTTFQDDQFVFKSLDYGAIGYVLKNTPIEDLIVTIRAARHGVVQISPDIVPQLVAHYREHENRAAMKTDTPLWLRYLTAREKEILQHMANGKDNHAIADELHLAPQTVKNHVSRIYDKLGAKDRIDAVRLVNDLGIDLRLL